MNSSNTEIKPKILYVDDESINLRLFKISYKDNYVVDSALSGEEALQLLNEGKEFDIIISDQRMPGMTGTDFMIEAKKILPNTKYILLTGYTDIEALERAINEVGLWQFVKKPWEPSNLKFIIDNAFSSLKTETENTFISDALQKSEERLSLALTGTNAGVWDWNLKTNEMYFSPTWKSMLGFEMDELENNIKTLEKLLHPEDLQKAFNHLDEYMQGHIADYEIEYRLKHKNGEYMHILSRARGKANDNGEIERLTGTNIDLTEKYLAQQQIKELNEELEERVERRTHALKLLNIQLIQRNKFEHLISKISSELIAVQASELYKHINNALGDVLDFSSAENTFVLKLEQNNFVVEYERSNEVHQAEIRSIFNKKPFESFQLIWDKLNSNDPLIIKDVNNLPEEFQIEKKQLIQGKVSSILIIPLTFNKELKGAFGLSFSSKLKEWNQEDINLLKFIGEIFTNAFERNESEIKLIKRDAEISEANQTISENEKRTKLLQNIASIANSPLQIEEALNLSHEIIITQSKGISGILVELSKKESELHFSIENIIAKTVQEKNNLTQLFLRPNNELKRILSLTYNSFKPVIEKSVKLNYNPNTLISYSFDITAIPVIVGTEMPYIYLTLLPPNNNLFTDQAITNDISREISFVVERDISKKGLKKALEKEKELGELKSQFVSMASHQFRTPLTVIQSNVELFQMLAGNIDDELKGKFNKISGRIQDEVARLGDLMNDVLLLGKLNADVMIAEISLDDITQEISEITGKINTIQTDGRKAKIAITGTPQKSPYDKKLFIHAYTNLLENAFKYSRECEPPIVEVIYAESLKIKVTDFGRGIPEEDISKLFQPFFRSNSTQDIEGTGLGLVICKRYLELQDGKLSVESEQGVKTQFTIELPLSHE